MSALETDPTTHVLVCFDGTAHAEHAIREGGRLLRGRHATVLYAWSTGPESTARFGAPAAWGAPESFARDREHAHAVAREGAALARRAGFEATPLTAHGALPAWAIVLSVARRVEADLIVLGSRGLTGVRSFILGSTSHHVVNLSHVPTLVIPAGADADAAVPADAMVHLDAPEDAPGP
jgi:nucleotide-binding universal stress UspA family protein